ncbi:MAG TPA: hypothetical protein VEU33_12880 [Archangium sp.]|nr:hypothetical protein [Archangium sp.]
MNQQATKIAASAERVWKLFSTHEGQREGHLGVAYVKERCDHYDEANMEMVYQITDTGGLVPFAD